MHLCQQWYHTACWQRLCPDNRECNGDKREGAVYEVNVSNSWNIKQNIAMHIAMVHKLRSEKCAMDWAHPALDIGGKFLVWSDVAMTMKVKRGMYY